MQTNERVVVIKGDASKWYSQAVFFINPGTPTEKIPIDFVAEAENIIYNYMAKKHKNTVDIVPAYMDRYSPPTILAVPGKQVAIKSKKRIRFDFIMYALMIAACIAMAAVLAFGLLN